MDLGFRDVPVFGFINLSDQDPRGQRLRGNSRNSVQVQLNDPSAGWFVCRRDGPRHPLWLNKSGKAGRAPPPRVSGCKHADQRLALRRRSRLLLRQTTQVDSRNEIEPAPSVPSYQQGSIPDNGKTVASRVCVDHYPLTLGQLSALILAGQAFRPERRCAAFSWQT